MAKTAKQEAEEIAVRIDELAEDTDTVIEQGEEVPTWLKDELAQLRTELTELATSSNKEVLEQVKNLRLQVRNLGKRLKTGESPQSPLSMSPVESISVNPETPPLSPEAMVIPTVKPEEIRHPDPPENGADGNRDGGKPKRERIWV
jgi:hypothetical protein